jgi:predicted  nucleic acid-binding Zn-ribbon protein
MVSKADPSLLSNAKARKRVLQKEAEQVKKQVAKLAAQLNELQQKIDVIDKLIASEGPKKKPTNSTNPEKQIDLDGMGGRRPAAVKK